MLARRGFLGGVAAVLADAAFAGCRGSQGPAVAEGSSAERAVRAARKYAGLTLTIASESGPQAQSLVRFSGPRWEELTGIGVQVIELGMGAEIVLRLVDEHAVGSHAIDCASVAPAWLEDLVDDGVLAPLDELVAAHMRPGDLDDYLPRYRDLGCVDGRRYGLFDDGDTLLLYYRRDLFEDPANAAAFVAANGRPLGDPRTFSWEEFVAAARFFTDREAGRYGLAPFSEQLYWGWFQALLHARRGRLFDPVTMRAEVGSSTARQLLADLLALGRWAPSSGLGSSMLSPVSTWLAGNAAMATFWPPLARWAEGYGRSALGGTPASQVSGRTGYALLPGGTSQLSVAYLLAVMAESAHRQAAYLFLQWLSSPDVSLERVMLPYALRDPYRRSHLASPSFRALWPTAPAYLATVEAAADRCYLDLGIPGAIEYQLAFQVALWEVEQGGDLDGAMARLAAAWDGITDRHGRRRQRAAYTRWLARATPRPAT